MADSGHELTEEILKEIEDRCKEEYEIAAREMRKKYREYRKRWKEEDEIMRARLKAGEITKKDYSDWVFRKTMNGKQWESLRDTLAHDLQHTNELARGIAADRMPDVFALNMNFGTYQIEHGGRIDTQFALYNRDAAAYLMQERQLMPGPSSKKAAEIAANKALQWDKRKIQSAVLQGILQGENPTIVAQRLTGVAQMDYNAAVRYARTMATDAQNAGRYESYRRAQKLGVDLTIEWQATLDGRTRHEHRLMDGQRRDVDEPFVVGGISIMWPAQSHGPGASDIPQSMIWNCRCTLKAWVKGFEPGQVTSSPKMGGMSYEEWKHEKEPKPKNVASQATTQAANSGIIRDYSSTMANAIGQNYYDSVCDMLDSSSNDEVKKLYETYINGIDADPNHKGGAYHQSGKIYYNAAADATDRPDRKKHSTYFHETGHGLDYNIAKANGTSRYYSQTWQGGKYSKTIHSEVDDWVNQRGKELKAGFAANRTDVAWLKANGFLTDYGEQRLQQYCTQHNVLFDDILSGKHTVTSWFYKDYVPKYSKDIAYKSVEKEISDLIAQPGGDWSCHALSDIVNGASRGKMKPGWGHKDSYWKDHDVCLEAFAEMCEAYVSGPESLAMLKKYLPKSLLAFDEMIAEYIGGIP